MKIRNNAIDILKGIGIILVLVAHSLGGFISQFSYTFHMPLFFIVTGLFISEFCIEKENKFCKYWKNAIIKDFKRLVYPALFTTACIILVSLLYFVFPNSYLTEPTLLLIEQHPALWGDSIIMLGNLWFLFALFFAKIYFYLLRQYTNGWKSLLSLSFLIGGLAIICGKYFSLPFCSLVGFSILPYINIGYVIKQRGGVEAGIPRWAWILILVWAVYIFFGRLQVGRMEYSWGYIPDVMAACGGTLCFYKISTLIDKHFKFISKILAFLGTNSLILICAPTIETYCFPFQTIIPDIPFRVIFVLMGKVIWCAIAIYACMKVTFLTRVFGVK